MTNEDVFKRLAKLADVPVGGEAIVACADLRALLDALKKAQSRERFAWTVARAPTPDSCRNCGRLVLAGRCCDAPDFPPYPPPVAELAQMLHEAEALRPLVERLLRASVPMAHGRCEVLTVDVDELRDALGAKR